jgi:hypothetical protein
LIASSLVAIGTLHEFHFLGATVPFLVTVAAMFDGGSNNQP